MMHNQGNCSFCGVADAILRNGLAFALYDTSPVSPGHALIIPVRHVADYFDTSAEEREAMMALAMEIRKLLERSRHPMATILASTSASQRVRPCFTSICI